MVCTMFITAIIWKLRTWFLSLHASISLTLIGSIRPFSAPYATL
jgi:phosphate/sulfate permease